MASSHPILISIIQFSDDIASGKMTVAQAIAAAKRLGADGIELRPDYLPDRSSDIASARQLLDQMGLKVTYATTSTLFNADQKGRDRLNADMADAVQLGSPIVRVFLGAMPDADDDAGWAGASDAVRQAQAHNLVIALENYAIPPGNRLAQIQRALEKIDAPNLGTNIDIGNYDLNGEDLLAVIDAIGHRAVSTHLKDNADTPDGVKDTYLGAGRLPLADVLGAFDRLGRPLIHCFEFGGGGDPEGRITKSIAFLREG